MTEFAKVGKNRWWKRFRIIGLILLGLASLWQVAHFTWNNEVQQLKEQADHELRLHISTLQGKLDKYEYLAELLATKEDLVPFLREQASSEDYHELNLTLDIYRMISGVSDIYLMDAKGDTLAASNWWRHDRFIGQNFSFRPYFQMAMQGKRGHFYGLGTSSGERGYYFSYPVFFERQVLGTLVVKIEIHTIEEPWLDSSSEVLVTDPDGVIFISSRPEWRLLTLTALSSDKLQRISDSLRYIRHELHPLPITSRKNLHTNAQRLKIQLPDQQTQSYLKVSRSMPGVEWDIHKIKKLDPAVKQTLQVTLLAGFAWVLLALVVFHWVQRSRNQHEQQALKEQTHRALQQAHDELENRVATRTAALSSSNQHLLEEIHQHQQTEAALRSTQKELIQTAKLAMLGQLSASLNHELSQPLTALRSYAENARIFLARNKSAQVDSNLEQILELTERMAEISSQLKAFSRKSGEQLLPVSVQAACDYALRLYYNPIQQENIHIDTTELDKDSYVLADQVRLEQVVVNLLSNALHALKPCQTKSIRLSTHRVREKVTEEEEAAARELVCLQIWDSGPGIAPEQLEEIFDPFVTYKEAGQGMGLGLSISSRIAEELNGRLEAANHNHFREISHQDSTSHISGAVFSLYLPACCASYLPS